MKNLIITNDFDKWRDIFFELYQKKAIQTYQERWSKYEKYLQIDNDIHELKTEIKKSDIGRKYDFIILDKEIPKEILDNIILPNASEAVLYTFKAVAHSKITISKWIKYNENDGCDCWGRPEYITKYQCDHCGYINSTKTNYCPNCGIKKENT